MGPPHLAHAAPADQLDQAIPAERRALSSTGAIAIANQVPPFSVIFRTSAKPPRRPCADAERSLSSSAASTFAAAGC
jgi:hypothetical protein